VSARDDALHQAVKRLVREAGPFDHAASLLRLRKTRNSGIHVVIERKQVDASVGQPLADLSLRIEIEGLVPQMEAGVRRESRPQGLDRQEQFPCIISAAKAGLPGPSRGVINSGDSVADSLPVAVNKRYIDGRLIADRVVDVTLFAAAA
jgi:hypothetical protein